MELTRGALTVAVSLDADGRAWLTVRRDGREVLPRSPIGLRTREAVLDSGLVAVDVRTTQVGGAYRMRTGKRIGEHRYLHDEMTCRLRTRGGLEVDLVVRLTDDGTAYRWVLPAECGEVLADLGAYRVRGSARAWLLEYTTWYEMPRFEAVLSQLATGDYGYPALVADNDDFLLLTEADIDGSFCGSFLRFDGTQLAMTLADDVVPIQNGPLATPWRVVIVGDLPTVFASSLVDELSPHAPPELADATWIRPGRAAWSWWSDHFSGAYLNVQRSFVDYAAELGWEHLLVDCGWDATWVPELVAYASRRGIQVHLWTAWDRLESDEGLAQLALWRSWGVAGVKIDFMESESRERYRWYDRVLVETARLGLMVNFHGSVIPRGWQRTWPHVMAYEGIRGAEYYSFYQEPLTAAHNTIQPFTRNVVGSMDYTPVTFTAHERETSDGHELALAVVFESGIQHFADHVDAYGARPAAARLLRQVAAAWDESRLVAGYPGREAVVARRSGDTWFVGAIAAGPARTVAVPLDFLGDGVWAAEITTDATAGLTVREREARAGDVWSLPLADNGGFTIVLRPAAEVRRALGAGLPALPPTDDSLAVSVAHAGAEATASAIVTAAPGQAVRVAAHAVPEGATLTLLVPPAWHGPEPTGNGREWLVTVPATLAPGQLGVLTVLAHRPGADVPLTAHARVVAALAPGRTALSSLPFVLARNGLGPVERDMSNGGGDPADGKPMSIAGRRFDTGLGVCAPAEVEIHVGGGACGFTALVGIDDETGGLGVATFEVHADDNLVATAGPVRGGEPAIPVKADVTGAQTVRLVVRGDDPVHGHGNWADAYVHV